MTIIKKAMRKEKKKLQDLKVNSFITSEQEKINGGFTFITGTLISIDCPASFYPRCTSDYKV